MNDNSHGVMVRPLGQRVVEYTLEYIANIAKISLKNIACTILSIDKA